MIEEQQNIIKSLEEDMEEMKVSMDNINMDKAVGDMGKFESRLIENISNNSVLNQVLRDAYDT